MTSKRRQQRSTQFVLADPCLSPELTTERVRRWAARGERRWVPIGTEAQMTCDGDALKTDVECDRALRLNSTQNQIPVVSRPSILFCPARGGSHCACALVKSCGWAKLVRRLISLRPRNIASNRVCQSALYSLAWLRHVTQALNYASKSRHMARSFATTCHGASHLMASVLSTASSQRRLPSWRCPRASRLAGPTALAFT